MALTIEALNPAAVSAVEQWLDAERAMHAVRTSAKTGEVAAWRIPANDARWPELRVGLPVNFPAVPPSVSVSKNLHLQKPHVEADGQLCHGIAASADGVALLKDVLRQVKYLVESSESPAWCEEEFHRERASYWFWFTVQRRSGTGAQPATPLRVVEASDDGCVSPVLVITGQAAGKKRRNLLAFAGKSREQLASFVTRHEINANQISYGTALFIGVSTGTRWTPSLWPNDYAGLRALATDCGFGLQFDEWWQHPDRKVDAQSYVVFRVDGTFFAYQLSAPILPKITPPQVEPVRTERHDTLWCLSRDHESQRVTHRLQQRVVLLGCGSVGSHLASHLARAGFGHIDLVDPDTFGPENVARHMLGMGDIGKPKTIAVTTRLKRDVPGIEVVPHTEDAIAWLKGRDLSDVALIIDATGEQGVRSAIRTLASGIPLATVWAEPFCAAAHVVLLPDAAMWPNSDPVDRHVNAYDWQEDTRVALPACGAGFHPYADADIAQVSSFCAEKVVAALDSPHIEALVWSQVRAIPVAAFQSQAQPRITLPTGLSLGQLKRNWADIGA